MTGPVSSVLALCVLLAVTSVTVQSGSLRLLTARGERKDASPQLTLSVDYEAAQKPQVVWFADSLAQPYPAQTTFANGKGTSTLTLEKARDAVSLAIGDLRGQYFEMTFISSALGSITQPLNVQQKDVQPGHDLGYTSGPDLVVTMTTTKGKGQNIQGYGVSDPYGFWVLPGSDQLGGGEYPNIPALTMTKTDSAEKLEVGLTFVTKHPINGVLMTAENTQFSGSPRLLDSISDVAALKIHEKSIEGPFPDTFLSVEVKNGDGEKISQLGCIPGFTPSYLCVLKCEATGNDIESVKLLKVKTSLGAAMGYQVENKLKQVHAFTLEARAQLDMAQDFAGAYRCEAKTHNGVTKVQEVNVVKVTKRAQVLGVTRTTLDNSDIELECRATGDAPLQVFFSWASSSNTPIASKDKHVVDLKPPTQSGADVTTKITLRPPLKESGMFCVAKNVASNEFWFVGV